MVNTIEPPIDPAFPPSHLEKKDDPRVPTIDCMIEGSTFYKTFCDINLSINIMSTVTYIHLYHHRPLCPTYLQPQLVDQSFRFLEGIAKDVVVKIRDHEVPTDFMVLDMGEEDDVHLILGRLFLHITSMIIYMKLGEIHFTSLERRYIVTLIVIILMRSPRGTGIGDTILYVKNNKPSRRKGLIKKRKLLKEKLP